MTHNKRLFSRIYVFLLISNFFLFFGDNLLLPVIAVYVKQLGANSIQIGAVSGVFYFTSILMRVFTAKTSRLIGKKNLLIMAMVLCCAAMLGYWFAATLIAVVVIRLLQGLGFGSSTTLFGALVADTIPDERMGEGMGYFGLGITVAAALGPFLGGAVVTRPDYKWIFFVAALLMLISILLTLFIKADNSRRAEDRKTGIKSYLLDFVEMRALFPSVFMLLIGISMGGVFTYVVLFGVEKNISGLSVFFIITSAAEFLARLISGKIYDKKGMGVVVVPGAICGIAAGISLSIATNFWMVAVAGVFTGLSYGMVFPVMEAISMKSVSPDRRVAANATLYNLLDIGCCIGPIAFGAVMQVGGYSAAFLICVLVSVVMLILVVLNRVFKWRTAEGLPNLLPAGTGS